MNTWGGDDQHRPAERRQPSEADINRPGQRNRALPPRPLSSHEAEVYRARPVPDFADEPYLDAADKAPRQTSAPAHYLDVAVRQSSALPERRPGPVAKRSPRYDDDRSSNGGPTRLSWILGALSIVACVGVGIAYFVVNGGGTDSETNNAAAGLPVDAPLGTDSTQAADAAGDEATPSATEPIELADGTVLLPSNDTNLTGTMIDGEILVAGSVPSTQASAGLVLLLENVVGVGNVNTDSLTIEPDAPTPDRIALIVGSEVVFAVGSDEIETEFIAVLDNMVALLRANPDVTAVIEGHADADGNRSQNLSLSQRRADAVVDQLVSKGIERFRLVAIGRGSDEPVADNSTAAGRAQNRRIEFVVVGFRLNL